ncbi:MAG TPA: HU family DNA-binding protein [Bacteroidales bacterium]|nr:HU family DNA-binding protein [Bacteroidales bacterium]HSA44061.1 HU family DNA-binding protein [Bacteroidales bacterium]
MNKKELTGLISADARISIKAARCALEAIIDIISKALKKGDRVTISGFGSFMVWKRPARKGRNPLTGKEIVVPAKKVVKFRPVLELTD